MSSAAQAGNIKLVRGSWNKAFIDELEQAGPDPKLYDHDDQWDAGSSAFNYLASHRQDGGMMLVRNGRVIFDSSSSSNDLEELRKGPQLGTFIKSRRWGADLDSGDDARIKTAAWLRCSRRLKGAFMEIRDRVVELRRVRAKDLVPNPKIGGAIRRFRPVLSAAC